LARAQPSRSRPVSQWIGVALDEIAATSAIALELVRAHALARRPLRVSSRS
jgi:hypothetical protein